MKTKEELNALKKEAEMLYNKLNELTDDELSEVVGGEVLGYEKEKKLQPPMFGGKPWFSIGAEGKEKPNITWGENQGEIKPYESESGTTPTIIK